MTFCGHTFDLMKKCRTGFLTVTIAIGGAFACLGQPPGPSDAGTPASDFEELPELKASEILKPEILKGPNYTVRESVPTFLGYESIHHRLRVRRLSSRWERDAASTSQRDLHDCQTQRCFTDGIRGTQARAGCNIRPDVAPLATGTANSRNYGARSIHSRPA